MTIYIHIYIYYSYMWMRCGSKQGSQEIGTMIHSHGQHRVSDVGARSCFLFPRFTDSPVTQVVLETDFSIETTNPNQTHSKCIFIHILYKYKIWWQLLSFLGSCKHKQQSRLGTAPIFCLTCSIWPPDLYWRHTLQQPAYPAQALNGSRYRPFGRSW